MSVCRRMLVLRRGNNAALTPKYDPSTFSRQILSSIPPLYPTHFCIRNGTTTSIDRRKKFQTVFAREADKRRKSTGSKIDAINMVQRDDKISTPGIFRRMATSVFKAESLVLPRDSPQKAYIAPLYPTIFLIEATAQERSISDEEALLLAVKNTSPGSGIEPIEPVNLRWM